MTDDEYLRTIEVLARDVVAAAERDDGDPALKRAITELARTLRTDPYLSNGLVTGAPILHLGGASVFQPGTSATQAADYRDGCARLGVAPRDEGWALWHTWDDRARAHTMVTTALDETRALLADWAQGRDVHPAQPRREEIAAVVFGWVGPRVLSPSYATTRGLGGR